MSAEDYMNQDLCDFSDESGEYHRTDTVLKLMNSYAEEYAQSLLSKKLKEEEDEYIYCPNCGRVKAE